MKKSDLRSVLKILFGVFILSFMIDKLFYFSVNNLSTEVTGGRFIGKLNHFLKVKDSLDVVVFGSSRAFRGINMRKISNSGFNMGLDGRSLFFYAPLIKTLPLHKPQIVMIHLNSGLLFDSKPNIKDIHALNVLYHRNEIIRREINHSKEKNRFQNIYWSVDFNHSLFEIIGSSLKSKVNYFENLGYSPYVKLSPKQKKLREKYFNSISENCSDEYKRNIQIAGKLRELQIFCKKNNKILVLFTSPENGDGCPTDNAESAKFFKTEGFVYWDFTNLFRENNSIHYWKDNAHLSEEGAELFTEALVNQLKAAKLL